MNIVVVFEAGYEQIEEVTHYSSYYQVDESGTLHIHNTGGRAVASYARKIWRRVYEL